MNGDLAKRFAAHPRFEWRPGMLALHTGKSGPPAVRCLDWPRNGEQRFEGWHGSETADVPLDDVRRWFVPDLDDAPTAGALLGVLVDEGCLRVEMGYEAGEVTCNAWHVDTFRPDSGRQRAVGWAPAAAAASALLGLWGES